jgi:hypothetical protein
MNWHLPHLPNHDERDMLQARLKQLEIALRKIVDIADTDEDADKALINIANIADAALKL